MPRMGKTEEDWNGLKQGFWKLFSLTVFQSWSLLLTASKIMLRRLCVNFIAVRKYNFLDYFLFCFVYKLFAVTIRNISLQFLYSLLQVYIVHRVSFIFHLNVFLVSVCTRGFGYLLCWPRGRGKGLVCTRRFSFHEFYNFLLFNFLIFISFCKTFFLPTTFTHTHIHDPHPRPTTHDI